MYVQQVDDRTALILESSRGKLELTKAQCEAIVAVAQRKPGEVVGMAIDGPLVLAAKVDELTRSNALLTKSFYEMQQRRDSARAALGDEQARHTTTRVKLDEAAAKLKKDDTLAAKLALATCCSCMPGVVCDFCKARAELAKGGAFAHAHAHAINKLASAHIDICGQQEPVVNGGSLYCAEAVVMMIHAQPELFSPKMVAQVAEAAKERDIAVRGREEATRQLHQLNHALTAACVEREELRRERDQLKADLNTILEEPVAKQLQRMAGVVKHWRGSGFFGIHRGDGPCPFCRSKNVEDGLEILAEYVGKGRLCDEAKHEGRPC
jgi:FtsZ-binding cell division protein ZapB